MKIAIQAADLDNKRIDGTRVYLFNVLKYLGKISSKDDFFIYHRNDFNPSLTPPNFSNYKLKSLGDFRLWTQTRFAWNIWRDKADILWMPMHNLPIAKRNNLKTVVTIHDLAFKNFPQTFPKKDLIHLNLLTDLAVNFSDKIIAVSQSTKNDILKFYPKIREDKIRVIYHGFDADLFRRNFSREEVESVLDKHNLESKKYLLYVGAIQPRKNLGVLIKAFELLKREANSDLKLVLAGSRAWCWEETVKSVEMSPQKKNIVLTGRVSFDDLAILYQNAKIFIFPSLYEGFGIPILEAFASKIPVISSNNSSLTEVGGEASEYFDGKDEYALKEKIENIINSSEMENKLIEKGLNQLNNFSWEKCARETLEFIKK